MGFISPDNLRLVEEDGVSVVYVGCGEGEEGGIGTIKLEGGTACKPSTATKGEYFCTKIGAHPEGFQVTEHAIYANLADISKVVAIDRKTKRTKFVNLPSELRANFPMAIDDRERIYIACRYPKPKMVAIVGKEGNDIFKGTIEKTLPCAADSDDIFFDKKRRCLYVIGGEGNVSVFDCDDYSLVDTVPTAVGARTGFMLGNKLYVAAPAAHGLGARLLIFQMM